MKKILKTFGIGSSLLIQIAIFAIAVVLIFAVSYIVGNKYLQGNTLWGNDTFSYYTVVSWISQYFPKVYFWFEKQGGGVSLTAGYPYLAAYMVVAIMKFFHLGLSQSMRILGFLTVPLTGLGVFIYAWTRLTSVRPTWMRQVLGIIAALFYVVAPASWIWLVKWGFYSEQVSHILIPPTVIFFDLFVERLFSGKKDFLYRVGIVGTAVFWALAFMVHFLAGVTVIPLFAIILLVHFIVNKENRFALFKRIFFPILILGFFLFGLFIFRYYPYAAYNRQVAVGGFRGYGAGDAQGWFNNTLTPKMMLSLEDIKDVVKDYRYQIINMRYPFYVWLLAGVGVLIAFFTRNKKMSAFGIYGSLGFLVSTVLSLKIYLSTVPIVSSLAGFMEDRGYFIVAGLVIPILAAYGAYALWDYLGSLILRLVKKIKVIYYILYPIEVLLVLAATLVTIYLAVMRYYSYPYKVSYIANVGSFDGHLDLRDIWGYKQFTSQYAPGSNDKQVQFLMSHQDYAWYADYIWLNDLCVSSQIPLADYPKDHICSYIGGTADNGGPTNFPPESVVKNTRQKCLSLNPKDYTGLNAVCKAFYKAPLTQLQPASWKPLTVSNDVSGEVGAAGQMFASLPQNSEYRYDISGFSGRTIMIAPMVNPNSQLQVYINTLSLIYNSWNYQSQVMYTVFPLYQKPGVLTQLAKWFGINYVYLAGSGLEPFDYWSTDPNWSKVVADSLPQGWRKFNGDAGVTSLDNKPRMLVISDNNKGFYDQTFRFFTWGGLLYDQAIPVMGGKDVDSYSLSELEKYDFIFMRGYGYKSKSGAYRLLDKYVKNGGKLIFDTGWQYNIPDWQIGSAPSFMPFYGLEWKNLSTSSSFKIEDSSIAGGIDVSKFGPLIWENTSWGVSVPTKLRSWAKTVLSYDGSPLAVTGDYGKGKVIWFGFNLVPHSESKDSQEEVNFFNKLFLSVDKGSDIQTYGVSRKEINPDKMEFTLQGESKTRANLFFKEGYYPDWKATLVSGNKKTTLRIDRAGPGFMLIQIPSFKNGDKVNLEIKKSFPQHMADLVSLLTPIFLILFLFYPKIYNLVFKNLTSRILTKYENLNLKGVIYGKYKKISSSSGRNEDIDY